MASIGGFSAAAGLGFSAWVTALLFRLCRAVASSSSSWMSKGSSALRDADDDSRETGLRARLCDDGRGQHEQEQQ